MKAFLASLFSSQPPPPAKEGLPYWAFWFLLCIILLLVVFIFLRDKDLRQRLDSFFFKTKIKLIKIRLQAKLKKEKQEKVKLLKSLGKKAFQENFLIEKGQKIITDLQKIEKEGIKLEKDRKEIISRIESLKLKLAENKRQYEEQLKHKERERKPFKEKLTETKERNKIINLQIEKGQKEAERIEKKLNEANQASEPDNNLSLSNE